MLSSSTLKLLALVVLFTSFFIVFLQMLVSNADLWWHLATGKYVLENRSLLRSDSFSYTAQGATSVLLSGYWLSQVFFYKLYTFFGIKGIVVLRALSITLFLLMVYLVMSKKRVFSPVSLLFLLLLFWFSLNIEGERPQIFLILAFSLIFLLLEDFRTTGSKKVYSIPLIVMVLANMHPGYIMCILLVSLYLAGEGLRLLSKKSGSRGNVRTLFVVWAVTLLLSNLNPNGMRIFVDMLSSQFFTKGDFRAIEFMPTFYLYTKKIYPPDYPYLILLLLSLLVLICVRKMSFVHLIVVVVFTVMSFVAYRYLVFYMCVATPIIADLVSRLREERISSPLAGSASPREGFVAAFSLMVSVTLLSVSLYTFRGFKGGEDVFFHVPRGAADFLGGHKVEGNMFNGYKFGGYLIWKLYPDKKVFIDSRALSYKLVEEYQTVVYATEGPQGSWKDIISRYDISYVLVYPLLADGALVPIVETLLDSDEWALIYADHLALIFMRLDGRNIPLIRQYQMDKKKGMNTIVAQATAMAMQNRGNAKYLVTVGRVFFKMGKFLEAEKAFTMASQRDPGNPTIAAWLEKARGNKGH